MNYTSTTSAILDARKRFNLTDDFFLSKCDYGYTGTSKDSLLVMEFTNRKTGEEVKATALMSGIVPKEGEFWRYTSGYGELIGVVKGEHLHFGDGSKVSILEPNIEYFLPPRKKGEFKRGDIVNFWGQHCVVIKKNEEYVHHEGDDTVCLTFVKVRQGGRRLSENRWIDDENTALVSPSVLKLVIPIEIR